MAEIFFDGRIYVSNQDMVIINNEVVYDLEIPVVKYIVLQPHPFTDGQNVTGLYKLRHQKTGANEQGDIISIIAIPIPPKAEPVEGIEKEAKELVDKFRHMVIACTVAATRNSIEEDYQYDMSLASKQCALIDVQHTIDALKSIFGQDEDKQPDIVYYTKLKEAINKL